MNKSTIDFKNLKPEDFDKTLTVGGLFTCMDDFFIPKLAETLQVIVHDEINKAHGGLKHELKEYIDKKLAENNDNLLKRLNIKFEKDKQFKTKEIALFKSHQIGAVEDIKFLEGCV